MILGSDINYSKLWTDVKKAGTEILKEVPKVVQAKVEEKATAAVTPTLKVVAEKKAERAVSAGNVALLAGIGVLVGGLVAGPTWTRRGVGAAVGGLAGGLAGLKIGLLKS